MDSLNKLKFDLLEISDSENAEKTKRFFKTGKNQYAQNDVFIGIRSPDLKELSKKYKDLNLKDLEILLKDYRHEFRQVALFILVNQYQKTKETVLVDFYLDNLSQVNNWDLVDISCRDILGQYCYKIKDTSLLTKLAKSQNLWFRRISMVSNWYLIRKKNFSSTFEIAKILLQDEEEIVQKAIGWMLKEAWEKGANEEVEDFLFENYAELSRIALRTSVEKMPPEKKQYFMSLNK